MTLFLQCWRQGDEEKEKETKSMACRYSPHHPEAMSYILPQGGTLRKDKPVIPSPPGQKESAYTGAHKHITEFSTCESLLPLASIVV